MDIVRGLLHLAKPMYYLMFPGVRRMASLILRTGNRGFSLLEILVVLALLGIIFVFASPQLSSSTPAVERANVFKELRFDISRARTEAAAKGVRTIIAIGEDGKSYSLGYDYLPYNDPIEADDSFLDVNLPNTVSLASSQTIIFDPRGFLVDATGTPTTTALTVACRSLANATILIHATGLVSTEGE
jgi:prepilin-type N-terminal cleavage/methylation domain-containing protein